MDRFFGGIVVMTWNYQEHSMALLSESPSSSVFYDQFSSQKENPIMPFRSLFYLNTCNRTELYLEAGEECFDQDGQIAAEALETGLSGLPPETREFFISQTRKATLHRGLKAVAHLFKVASGLKSMAIGETQITGQLKRDFSRARDLRMTSPFFQEIIQKALETQKLIRQFTDIGRNRISLLSLLHDHLPAGESDLKHVMIGGTGDMAQKMMSHYISKGAGAFTIIRRDLNRPLPPAFRQITENHAGISFRYLSWEDLNLATDQPEKVRPCDIFLTSTESREPLISLEKLAELKNRGVLAKEAPIVDLAIPANIDTAGLSQAECRSRLYTDMETLSAISDQNRELRQQRVREATPYIASSIKEFWYQAMTRRKSEEIRDVLGELETDRKSEWQKLMDGPLKDINARQKRILEDYLRKQERKSIRTHRRIFLDLFLENSHVID